MAGFPIGSFRKNPTFIRTDVKDRGWSTSAAASLASALTHKQTLAPLPPVPNFRRRFISIFAASHSPSQVSEWRVEAERGHRYEYHYSHRSHVTLTGEVMHGDGMSREIRVTQVRRSSFRMVSSTGNSASIG
jgi:hypothetical protein